MRLLNREHVRNLEHFRNLYSTQRGDPLPRSNPKHRFRCTASRISSRFEMIKPITPTFVAHGSRGAPSWNVSSRGEGIPTMRSTLDQSNGWSTCRVLAPASPACALWSTGLAHVMLAAVIVATFLVAPARGQLIVGDSSVGYIDSAILKTQVRVRFDAAYKSRSADRVEFVYAKYGQPGAPRVERGIDSHQELAAYLEYKPMELLSFFTEVPFRWIDPIVNENTGGMYDMTAGLKLSLAESRTTQLTGQFRTYIPTGDNDSGLGTNHVSLEPSILWMQKLSDRLTMEAELRDWIPIDASTTGGGGGSGGGGGGGGGTGQGGEREFSGNVLRYGLGLGYLAYEDSQFTVTPVTEVVGWHVFSGLKSTNTGDRISATNDSIANLKIGLRLGCKQCPHHGSPSDSLFIGYGRALTGDIWYSEILRVEFRKFF